MNSSEGYPWTEIDTTALDYSNTIFPWYNFPYTSSLRAKIIHVHWVNCVPYAGNMTTYSRVGDPREAGLDRKGTVPW